MEKWRTHPIIGGLIPLNAAGKYACPPLVVAGRAAVSLSTTHLPRHSLLGFGWQIKSDSLALIMPRKTLQLDSPLEHCRLSQAFT